MRAWIHTITAAVSLVLISAGLWLGVGLWAALLTLGVLLLASVVYARVGVSQHEAD